MRLISDFLFPWRQREILYQFVLRDIHARYRQSIFGLLWLVLTPLLTLAVYTLVFRFIFQSRWDMGDAGTMAFAFRLFVGLSLFSFFSDCLMRAPRLIVDQPNLVKKVVFPLPLLIWTQAISALVQLLLALSLLFVGLWIESGTVPWGMLGAPFIIIPVFYLVLGIAWCLASLGVYLRDLQQVIGLALSLMLFLTPIFYPLSALPAAWQEWMQWNLLAYWIETLRFFIFSASWPEPIHYMLMCCISLAIATLGALTFYKVQEGFADVL
jgi:lipopolysaccharide transport system permease protein